jgi:hypothetical protein
MALRRSFVAALMVLAACRGPSVTPAAVASSADARAVTSCARSWEETSAWAVALAREPSVGLGRGSVPLVPTSDELDPEAKHRGLDLVVTSSEIRDDDGAITFASLDDRLTHTAELVRKLRRNRPDTSNAVLVGIQIDVPWSRVVEVAEHIRRAGLEATFLFARAHVVEKPGWSWRDLQIRLAAEAFYNHADTGGVPLSGPGRPAALAQRNTLGGILAPCPELVRRVREGTHEAFVASLGNFVDECRCNVDQRSLRAALWSIHPADETTGRIVRLVGAATSSPPPGATVIEASADTPWAEVAPRIAALPSRAPVQLRVTQP